MKAKPGLCSSLDIKGFLRVALVDPRTQRVVALTETPNLLVNSGLNRIAQLALDGGDDFPAGQPSNLTYIGLGTSNASPTAGMTALQAPTTYLQNPRLSLSTQTSTATSQQVICSFSIGSAELTDVSNNSNVIGEVGLYDGYNSNSPFGSPNSYLFARAVLASPITKTTDLQVNVTYTLRMVSG
jgi:hypothetical protein